MAFDPEEFVTLTDHGTMRLRSAVSRAMTLLPKERKRATILRQGEPAILKFEQIKELAAQWAQRLIPIE
jgi:transposase